MELKFRREKFGWICFNRKNLGVYELNADAKNALDVLYSKKISRLREKYGKGPDFENTLKAFLEKLKAEGFEIEV
ncbi:MAG: hypothetical protein JW772_02640 [Candidatus Diapherotrites archaeon]|nr:hypothetical protein [Candidatus Diapherotrites archaeon]